MHWDDTRARTALRAIFDAGVASTDPHKVLARHLPERPPAASSWSAPASRPR